MLNLKKYCLSLVLLCAASSARPFAGPTDGQQAAPHTFGPDSSTTACLITLSATLVTAYKSWLTDPKADKNFIKYLYNKARNVVAHPQQSLAEDPSFTVAFACTVLALGYKGTSLLVEKIRPLSPQHEQAAAEEPAPSAQPCQEQAAPAVIAALASFESNEPARAEDIFNSFFNGVAPTAQRPSPLSACQQPVSARVAAVQPVVAARPAPQPLQLPAHSALPIDLLGAVLFSAQTQFVKTDPTSALKLYAQLAQYRQRNAGISRPMLAHQVIISMIRKAGYTLSLHPFVIKGAPTGVVQALLDNRANLNERDDRNRTTLMNAAARCPANALEIMITTLPEAERAAFVNHADSAGDTALTLAIASRRPDVREVVELLISHGADIAHANNAQLSAVRLAMDHMDSNNDAPLVALLLDRTPAEHRPHALDSALLYAAFKGRLAQVQQMVARDADINIRAGGPDASTPLLYAIQAGSNPIVGWMVANGASLTLADAQGNNPLACAAQQGKADITAIILGHVATLPADQQVAILHHTNQDGDTALHAAVQENASAVIPLLVNAGLRVNARNVTGSTPLMLAADNNNADTYQQLLTAGANASLTDHVGQTALMRSSRHAHDNNIVLRYLNNYAEEHNDVPAMFFKTIAPDQRPAILLGLGIPPEIGSATFDYHYPYHDREAERRTAPREYQLTHHNDAEVAFLSAFGGRREILPYLGSSLAGAAVHSTWPYTSPFGTSLARPWSTGYGSTVSSYSPWQTPASSSWHTPAAPSWPTWSAPAAAPSRSPLVRSVAAQRNTLFAGL